VVQPMVSRFPDAATLADAAAARLAGRIAEVVRARGRCRLALAGGSTPRPIYERWAVYDTGQLDWSRIDLFWGDERCVPADHPDSNYRMVHEALLRHVRPPDELVHRIPGELPPAEAAAAYEAQLGAEPLDIVLLGMGDDGHTASLFPGDAALAAMTRVAPALAPLPPRERVSLTLRALAEARAVFFVVAGASKAARVAEVFGEVAAGEPRLPAARVRPASGELHWYLDEAAARQLPHRATG
jgi:6-phosphogluconolactonase